MHNGNYLGIWKLIPELSSYQKCQPPLSGTYIISGDDHEIHIKVDWTDTQAATHTLEFGGALDGTRQQVHVPGITAVTYTKVDDNTLDSTAYNNDEVVIYARRVVSESKDLLAVTQMTHTPEGSFSNFQIYRREDL
jgi:hypothetical protein